MATIILAGGLSTRMGQDKASLPMGDSTILQVLTSRFEGKFGPVIVAARPEMHLTLERVVTVNDTFMGKGPLGGLHAGLLASPDMHNFVLACDMPFADPRLGEYLLGRLDGHDAVIPRLSMGLEPLHAAYSKTCIPQIGANLRDDALRMRDLLDRVDTLYVDEGELRHRNMDLNSFTNVNTPEEYLRLSIGN
ncbi:MAG: molybdenum cofactor guanylyltransferase [Armatimonadota bacterium]